jgi:hypothetical protein
MERILLICWLNSFSQSSSPRCAVRGFSDRGEHVVSDVSFVAYQIGGVKRDENAGFVEFMIEHLGETGMVLAAGPEERLCQGQGCNASKLAPEAGSRTRRCRLDLVYTSQRGHTMIDRELYLLRSWTCDPDRCAAAKGPGGSHVCH